jgi:hypothetical protein
MELATTLLDLIDQLSFTEEEKEALENHFTVNNAQIPIALTILNRHQTNERKEKYLRDLIKPGRLILIK